MNEPFISNLIPIIELFSAIVSKSASIDRKWWLQATKYSPVARMNVTVVTLTSTNVRPKYNCNQKLNAQPMNVFSSIGVLCCDQIKC